MQRAHEFRVAALSICGNATAQEGLDGHALAMFVAGDKNKMDGRVATSGETHRREEAAVLRVENLTVQYGALIALRDVSWSVQIGRNPRHHRTRTAQAKAVALPR